MTTTTTRHRPRSLRVRTAALSLALAMTGCVYDTWGFGTCVTDPGLCDPLDLELAKTCDDSSPLTVELGHGETSFISFADDPYPNAVAGPQGGSHLFAALRIDGAVKNRKLRGEFWAFETDADHPCEDDPSYCDAPTTAVRTFLLPSESVDSNRRLTVLGLFVYGSWGNFARVRIIDECGREATAEHREN